jgi:tetratricopeptide (TPR) repeat protein
VGVFALIDHLQARRFDELESALKDLAAAAERDPRTETDLAVAVDAVLGTGEPSRGRSIEMWARERPASAWAHAGLAHHYRTAGYRARGTKLASETPAASFDAMENWHERALREADRAAELDPSLVEPHLVRISVARAGWGGFEFSLSDMWFRIEGLDLSVFIEAQATCRSQAKEALAIAPWSYRVRTSLLACLDPMWGGSIEESLEVARAAQEHVDANPKLQALLGFPHYRLAQAARREGNLPLALDRVNCALAEGEYAEFYDTRASLYFRLERFDEALADRTRSVELFPVSVGTRARRAWDLARAGDVDAALAEVELVARLEPSSRFLEEFTEDALWDAAVEAAAWEVDQNRTEVALERLAEIAERRPSLPTLHYYLAYAHWDNQDHLRAEDALEEAIRLDPRYFEAIKLLDRLLSREQQWERILGYWNRYLALVPDDAKALFERSGTLHHLGDGAGALRDVQAACDLGSREACSMEPRVRRMYGE